MLFVITIAIVAIITMFWLFAMAEMATLFGADAFGDFLRDAGQTVGGAGGLGAAGAAGAGFGGGSTTGGGAGWGFAGGGAGGVVQGPPIDRTIPKRIVLRKRDRLDLQTISANTVGARG